VAENIKRWSLWKKLAIYPGYLALAVLFVCAWIVVDDTISPARIINDRADDSPRMAAMFLGALAFTAYAVYLICLFFIHALVRDEPRP